MVQGVYAHGSFRAGCSHGTRHTVTWLASVSGKNTLASKEGGAKAWGQDTQCGFRKRGVAGSFNRG